MLNSQLELTTIFSEGGSKLILTNGYNFLKFANKTKMNLEKIEEFSLQKSVWIWNYESTSSKENNTSKYL